jgi:hypothetical protein
VTLALPILLAPLLAAAVVSLAAALRDRELRHAPLLGLIGLLALGYAVNSPAAPGGLDRAFELESIPYAVALAVNLATCWLAIAATRSLHERNRAEQVHWRDMETLRELAETLRDSDAAGAPSPDALLAHGCRHFGFETGLLVRLGSGDAQIVASRFPPGVVGLAAGPCPELARTLALRCTLTADVVSVERASTGHWSTHPEHAPFGWEAFLGVRVDEGPGGTRILCFASRSPRGDRVVGAERWVMRVMASWLAGRGNPHDAAKPLVPASEPAAGIDLHRRLRGLETRLGRGLAPGRPLRLELDARDPAVGIDPAVLERVVTGMLHHAAEAGADDEGLSIRTRSIEPPTAGAPGFVSIEIQARGPALDAGALAALHDRATTPTDESGLRQLPLSRVARILRDVGGDLSMESEEGVGTTLTAFVPSGPAAP